MDSADWDSMLQYVANQGDICSFQSEQSVMTDISLHPQPPYPQLPSPPSLPCESQESPTQGDRPQDTESILSVSTTFRPDASLLAMQPDLVFLSCDGVHFYVHITQILSVSTNHFNDLVSPTAMMKYQGCHESAPVVPLRESAPVLNVILHAIYGMSCAHYRPSLDTLIAAVDAMPTYGLSPKEHITPSTPLYSVILSQAPLQPILIYALAAHHDLFDLAVPVSSHLLSFPLYDLTDELVTRMGPVYVKRLFFLHLGRLDALKRVLLPPPHPHPSTESCDFTEQKKLTRAWALASSYLAWEAHPAMSTSAMESALLRLADDLPCQMCKAALAERVKQLIVQWSVIKRSI